MKKNIIIMLTCVLGVLFSAQAQDSASESDNGNFMPYAIGSDKKPPIIARDGVPVVIDYINVYNADEDLVYQTTDVDTIYEAITPGLYILEVYTKDAGVLYVEYLRP